MTNIKQNLIKNWKNYVIVILLFGMLILSQGFFNNSTNSFSSRTEMAYDSMAKIAYYPSYGDGFAPEETDRKRIRNANINLETSTYDFSRLSIINEITKNKAIILNERESKYQNEYRSLYIQVKINSNNLDSFLEEVKNYGEIDNLNIYADDVTGTYVDYTDRLKRYNEQIVQYNNILKNPKIEIEEEIKIQQRIDQLEDQVFYLNRQLGNLEENIEYSQVILTLKEKPSVLSQVGFLGFKDSIKIFLQSLKDAFEMILYLLGFVIPFAIIYAIYRVIRKAIPQKN